jgi:hypothetical protein
MEVQNMADISGFIKQQGTFLKAENVGTEAVAKIVGECELVHNEKYDTDRLHIPITIGAEEYTFDCSKTNARTITAVLGNKTETWKGASLILDTYKTKTSEGKMVLAVNVKRVTA